MNPLDQLIKDAVASAPMGHAGISHQSTLPINERRELSEDEGARIAEEKTHLLPKIFHALSDRPEQDMYSPALPMTGGALTGGALGAVLGGGLGDRLGGDKGLLAGGGIGALLGALGGGALGNFSTKAHNESVEENMRRLPEGAVRRDIMADPLYQTQAQRGADASNMGLLAAALMTR